VKNVTDETGDIHASVERMHHQSTVRE